MELHIGPREFYSPSDNTTYFFEHNFEPELSQGSRNNQQQQQ